MDNNVVSTTMEENTRALRTRSVTERGRWIRRQLVCVGRWEGAEDGKDAWRGGRGVMCPLWLWQWARVWWRPGGARAGPARSRRTRRTLIRLIRAVSGAVETRMRTDWWVLSGRSSRAGTAPAASQFSSPLKVLLLPTNNTVAVNTLCWPNAPPLLKKLLECNFCIKGVTKRLGYRLHMRAIWTISKQKF